MVLNFKGSNDITLKTTQSDYTETDTGSISFINHKPTLLTTEAVQDIVGGMVTGNTESNISVTYEDGGDGAGKLNFDSTQLTTEEVQDIVGGMVTGNTETNIAVTYVDGGDGVGKLNFVSTDTNTQLSTDDVIEKMNTIIKYTAGNGGNDREVELIIPADSGSGGDPATTKISIKPLGITATAPFTFSDIYAANISSKADADLYIKHQSATGTLTTKINVSDDKTTLSSNTKITGDLEINSILDTATDQNLILKRSGAIKLTLGDTINTHKQESTFEANANFTGGLKTNNIKPASGNNDISIKSASTGTGDCHVGVFNGKSFRKVVLGCNNSNNSNDAHIYFVKDGVFKSYDGITSSDSRIKENQKEYNIEDSLNHIKSLKVKSYYNTDASANEVGLIAQEVAQVIPDAVSTHDLSQFGKLSDFKMLSYEKVFIHTIGAIQSLVRSIQELNQRIVELESK